MNILFYTDTHKNYIMTFPNVIFKITMLILYLNVNLFLHCKKKSYLKTIRMFIETPLIEDTGKGKKVVNSNKK